MQEFQGSATVPDEIINHGNDTIIIDVLVEDDSMKRIIFCERSQGHSSAGDGLAPAARVVAWDAATPLVIVLAGFSLPHGHRQVQFYRVLRASPEMPNAS